MPIYGYKCSNKKCKHEFEEFYTSSNEEKVKAEEKELACPKCNGKKKKRLPPQNTSFVLKGPGWYRDGY